MASFGIDRTGAAGGSGTASLLGSLADLADPGANSIIYWDDTANAFTWQTVSDVSHLGDIAGLSVTDGNFIVGDGTNWVAESGATARTSLGLGSLATASTINDGDWSGTVLSITNGGTGASTAALARTSLGLGSLATASTINDGDWSGTVLSITNGGTGTSTAVLARTALGLAIGTDVQAYNANLAAIAGLTPTDSNFIVGNGSTWVAESDATVRTSLGLGSLATANTISNDNWSGTVLSITNGGTGTSTAVLARTALGLAIGSDVQAYNTNLATIAGLADPNADRILFWDDSAGALAYLTAGTGLTITDTTISASSTGLTLGTEQASTSGSAIDFTGIPSGTKLIIIQFVGVSLTGSDDLLVQLGDAGGFENTGYTGCWGTFSSTAQSVGNLSSGFSLLATGSGATVNGSVILTLEDSSDFTWVSHGMSGNPGDSSLKFNSGYKSLSAELTQVRVTRTGTDTFDAGAINISYM